MHISLMKKFKEHIEQETGKKASVLFITHAHGDHVFGNQIFEGCEIITSNLTHNEMVHSQEYNWTPKSLEEWKKNSEDPSALDGLKIVLANKTFADEYELVDGDVKVIVKRTGGHTEGSSYVYCPNYNVMFAGDNLFNNQFPWGGSPSANPIKWIAALKEYLSLEVEHYIPGHGQTSNEEPIEEFLAYLEKVTSLIKKQTAAGINEKEILEQAEKIEYYPPREGREQWKITTLKKWYEVISSK